MTWTPDAYTVAQWQNEPSHGTPLDKVHLEAAEQSLADRINVVASSVAAYADTARLGGVLDGTSALAAGLADNTAALSALLDQANAAGQWLWLPDRDIVCGVIAKSYVPKIVTPGARIVVKNGLSAQTLWTFSGSVAAAVLTTGVTAEGDVIVPVPTAGIAAGDLVIIGENTPYNDSGGEANRYVGQQARVRSVDSGSQLTLWQSLYRGFSSGASVRKVAPIVRPSIKGLRFLNPYGSSPTDYMGAVALEYATQVDVDVDTEAFTGAGGVVLRDCYGGTVRSRNRFHVWNLANQQWGYGVTVARACMDLDVYSDAEASSSAITTTGEDNEQGEPLFCRFYIRAVAPVAFGASTHAAGRWITFVEPQVFKQTSSTQAGIGIACRDVTVRGGRIDQAQNGIMVSEAAHGSQILGTQMRDVTLNGVKYATPAPPAGFVRATLRDVVIDTVGQIPVRVTPAVSDFVMDGCTFRGWAQQAVSGERYGSRFLAAVTRGYITNNKWVDPGPNAVNEATFWGADCTGVQVVNNLAINLPNAAAFPARTGVAYSGNLDLLP